MEKQFKLTPPSWELIDLDLEETNGSSIEIEIIEETAE
tara:strand:- start:10432 stop:10545 length:114 start_codon:yes stop_codon:yes gene_type:complete